MIQVVIEMQPETGTLNIASTAPPPLVFGVITAAYHEMLSKKIQADLKSEQRIIEVRRPLDNGGLR